MSDPREREIGEVHSFMPRLSGHVNHKRRYLMPEVPEVPKVLTMHS